MRILHLPLLALAALPAAAQDAATVLANARRWVDTLASPALHGRGYVNGGDSLAAELIAAEFDRLGLLRVRDSRFEPFSFTVNTFPDSVKLAVDGAPLRAGLDFLVDPASGSAKGRYEVVHLTLSDLATPERRAMTMGVVAGRAIALHLPVVRSADSLALVRSVQDELLHYGPVLRRSAGKLTWGVSQQAARFPLLELRAEVWNDSAATIDLHVANRMRKHDARNVWGLVKGRSSKELVVVSAHYDHLGRMGPDVLFPGANDNASGVSMLLNLAARYAQEKPWCDVLFIAFAGEEAGLVGSEWCAVDRAFDLGAVKLLINLDLLGTGEEGITVVNATAHQEVFDRMVAGNTATGRLAQVKPRGPACNSDHCPFVKRGVPAIFIYTLGGIAAYHDVFDHAETLPLTEYHDVYLTLVDLINGLK
ncbi:MAG: M28 family peptidase [Flavobacteriales bacterium]|nr:M28 family peptidase [Flavobacteriales bacterium]